MTENTTFRNILPAKNGKNGFTNSQSGPPANKRSKLSLACTECQKKKTKCSGTTPCTRCATEAYQCIYDPKSDRRRRTYAAELLSSHVTLCRVTAMLRSGTLEEILAIILEIQDLPTDQEAIGYLRQALKEQ
ncbi:transcriptional regulator family: Fungal Specific TF [Penicillium roqueforti]|nr:transcriptional regulator family: Fungal Specific TF [Penicillium roqueforti]